MASSNLLNCINTKIWELHLERKLYPVEIKLFTEYSAEKSMNGRLLALYDICIKKGLYIPMLSKMDGNCLFESLVYLGIGNDITTLRNGIASIMYVFKDYPKFFPEQEASLNKLFTEWNDIEYVESDEGFENN